MWHLTLCFFYFISIVHSSDLSTEKTKHNKSANSSLETKKLNQNYRFLSIGLAMLKYRITPDVIPIAPAKQLKMLYHTDTKVFLGNILRPFTVKEEPKINWLDVDYHALHTLVMVDPDGKNQKGNQYREWKHWLVINMPGNIITLGETISRYIGPGPLPHSGFHRYVFLVYKQPKKLILTEPSYNTDTEDRENFSIANFSKKYNLGVPVAGNFFRSLYVTDNYESELLKEIKRKE